MDSESPVLAKTVWKHLSQRQGDGWKKPTDASDDQAFLMVQCMEAWFLADHDALNSFLNTKTFKRANNVESILKIDVMKHIEAGFKKGKQGDYRKGSDSWKILSQLRPSEIRRASKHAEDFFRKLEECCDKFKS